jgi:hypothetical protein
MGDELEQHRGFGVGLAHVAELIEDEHSLLVEPLQRLDQASLLLSLWQALSQRRGGAEVHPNPLLNEPGADSGRPRGLTPPQGPTSSRCSRRSTPSG